MIDVLGFVLQHKFVFLFYLFVILFIAFHWKRIERQAKIIFLYRTKIGLKWMEKYSTKFREWVILFGYVGMGAGFVGLVFISYFLVTSFIQIFTNPEAASAVSPVLPGISVPGLGVLSFWYWILAIFIIALVHEFSHGIVARAHKIEVKNTGIVFLGPIMGAFVEPDEKKLQKQQDIVQYSVLSAGSFSNIVLGVVVLLLLNFAFVPLQETMVEPAGFTFESYFNETAPIAEAGLKPGTRITGINGVPIKNFQEFSEELAFYKPGETIKVSTPEKEYSITLGANPKNQRKAFLGLNLAKNEFEIKERYQVGFWNELYKALNWFNFFLRWLFLLSIGIGLFNLLPLPIVDGGRMAQVFLQKLKGEGKGNQYYKRISLFFFTILVLLIINWLYPLHQLF
ncbi:MAG: site-2 protease family protein [Nanoarchaeota archaeon]